MPADRQFWIKARPALAWSSPLSARIASIEYTREDSSGLSPDAGPADIAIELDPSELRDSNGNRLSAHWAMAGGDGLGAGIAIPGLATGLAIYGNLLISVEVPAGEPSGTCTLGLAVQTAAGQVFVPLDPGLATMAHALAPPAIVLADRPDEGRLAMQSQPQRDRCFSPAPPAPRVGGGQLIN